MTRRTTPADPETIVAEHFPLDGPYDDDRTRAAAATLAELVRYLNYATGQGAPEALPYASTTGDIAGQLVSALSMFEQLFEQMADRVRQFADDPTLYDATVRDGERHTRAVARANHVVTDLTTNGPRAAELLRTVLEGVFSNLNALGHEDV